MLEYTADNQQFKFISTEPDIVRNENMYLIEVLSFYFNICANKKAFVLSSNIWPWRKTPNVGNFIDDNLTAKLLLDTEDQIL